MGQPNVCGQTSAGGGKLAVAVPAELVRAIAEEVARVLEERGAIVRPPASPYLDVDGAARYLGNASRQRLYDLVSTGRLEPMRDGRRLLFARAELDRYLQGAAAAGARA